MAVVVFKQDPSSARCFVGSCDTDGPRWNWAGSHAQTAVDGDGLSFRILAPDCVQLRPTCSFVAGELLPVLWPMLFWTGCSVFRWHVGSGSQSLDLWDVIVQMLLSKTKSFAASRDSLL